ncbi:MAG TPA: AAA family ATPase, partial [Candidatus Paceibacterota bacterium]|nr:AAA family ATPase [Candidatus Paceibacterota bacterium]HQM35160.1 AAA family ATPase [Candidatus Paceibacterota bacterium]
MKLKSLEILGFKSFANKIVFSFPANFTAIVGPNGSGKSNIVDAIRWVLGERDLKKLRVARADEVIFNGTPAKPRMSLAQVSMTLDNSQNELPIDFKEVVITRRLERGKENQYFINDAAVRLKDVVELLAKAKIGSEGLTIINQGLSDALLKASPKERRVMIEESLGLREFQLKKEDAKRKLEASQINLEKTQALLEELKPHLRSLRRQIHRWEKREEITQTLSILEHAFYAAKLKEIYLEKQQIDNERQKIEAELKQQEATLKELERQFDELEKKRPDFSQQFQDLRRKIDEIEKQKGDLLKSLGRIEGQIEGLKRFAPVNVNEPTQSELVQALKQIKEELNQVLNFDLEKAREKIKQLIKEIEKLFTQENISTNEKEIATLQNEKDKILAQIEKFNQQVKNYNEELDTLRKKDEEVGNDSHGVLLELQKQRNILTDYNRQLNEISLRMEKNKLHEADLIMRLKESELNPVEFQWEKIKDFDTEKILKENNISGLDDLEMRILRFRRELANIGEIDELTLKEAKETEDRYQFLSQQSEDLIKAKADLEKIIAELTERIDTQFNESLKIINDEFNKYFRMIFGGGRAKLSVIKMPKRQRKEKNEENNEEEKNKLREVEAIKVEEEQ